MTGVPDWRTSTKGTRVRAALWLRAEVGVGNVFTKSQLRAAFPGVEQIDRRMRDLRPDGWVIDTNLQDASLGPDELRFVQEGSPVWMPGASQTSRRPSAKVRAQVFDRDGYLCRECGIGPGCEAEDGSPVRLVAAAVGNGWITLCAQCASGKSLDDLGDFSQTLARLDQRERDLLLTWIARGKRSYNADRAWVRWVLLPPEEQELHSGALGGAE